MTEHILPLPGCTAEPLINYLKALGVLRIVSEQADPTARGCWRNGVFELRCQLSEGGLLSALFASLKLGTFPGTKPERPIS
jgi:CRISPR-associated protein Csx17